MQGLGVLDHGYFLEVADSEDEEPEPLHEDWVVGTTPAQRRAILVGVFPRNAIIMPLGGSISADASMGSARQARYYGRFVETFDLAGILSVEPISIGLTNSP